MLSKPKVETTLDHFQKGTGQLFVGQNGDTRSQQMIAGNDLTDRLAEPANDTVISQNESFIDRFMNTLGAAFDLVRQGLLRGGVKRFSCFSIRLRIGRETEARQMS